MYRSSKIKKGLRTVNHSTLPSYSPPYWKCRIKQLLQTDFYNGSYKIWSYPDGLIQRMCIVYPDRRQSTPLSSVIAKTFFNTGAPVSSIGNYSTVLYSELFVCTVDKLNHASCAETSVINSIVWHLVKATVQTANKDPGV